MQRTKTNKNPSAILTADWHLRESTPTCRTDDFQAAQWRKVDFIAELSRENSIPIIHAGDLFDHWKPSPWLISKTIEHLGHAWVFYTIYGNHDLPQHSLELKDKCGIYTMERALERFYVLKGTHWGQKPVRADLAWKNTNALVWHVMTYQAKQPYPGCKDPKAAKILRDNPEYDLILTGHNHTPFTETYKHQILVNPGGITRQEAGQQEARPRVYLYYADTNTAEPVYLPIESGVITREHIEDVEKRDARITAFIERLTTEYDASLSFEKNLEQFFSANDIEEPIKQIIYKALEA